MKKIIFLDKLKQRVRIEFEYQKDAAQFFNLSRQHLANILKGLNDPTQEVLDFMGYDMVKQPPVFIKRVKK